MKDEKKKGFIAEFKEFISRGNVLDMAVGVIVGGAFTAIVTSLVNDILMPLIGLLTGGADFSSLKVTVGNPIGDVAPATINYGMFIQQVVNFLIVAFVIFAVIKSINKFRRKDEPAEEPVPESETPEEVLLMREIRDLLAGGETADAVRAKMSAETSKETDVEN